MPGTPSPVTISTGRRRIADRAVAVRSRANSWLEEPGALRSSRQDCKPAGVSPAVTVARISHVAMPHPGRGNPPGDAWCKRPGRPVLSGTAVGATWGPSEWGRSKIIE